MGDEFEVYCAGDDGDAMFHQFVLATLQEAQCGAFRLDPESLDGDEAPARGEGGAGGAGGEGGAGGADGAGGEAGGEAPSANANGEGAVEEAIDKHLHHSLLAKSITMRETVGELSI